MFAFFTYSTNYFYTLYLVAIPPTITLHPFDHWVEIRFDAVLRCRAVGGSNLLYRWTHNNISITTSNAKGYDLHIANATVSDSGQYQCIATNSNGSVASNYATVIVDKNGELHVVVDLQCWTLLCNEAMYNTMQYFIIYIMSFYSSSVLNDNSFKYCHTCSLYSKTLFSLIK